MQIPVEISDELYVRLNAVATEREMPVDALIADAIRSLLEARRRQVIDFPVIRSQRPGSVAISAEMIHDAEMEL